MGLFARLFGYRPNSNSNSNAHAQPAPTVTVKQVSSSLPPPPCQYRNSNSNSNSSHSNSNSGVPSITPIPIDEDDETVVASTRSNRARRDIDKKFIAAVHDTNNINSKALRSVPVTANGTNNKNEHDTHTHTASSMLENNSNCNDMLENDEELNALIQRVRSVQSTSTGPQLSQPAACRNAMVVQQPHHHHLNPNQLKQQERARARERERVRAQDDIILNKTLSTLSDHKSTGLSMERFMYLNIARTVSSLSLDMSIETCNMKEDLLDSMAECPVINLRDKAMELRDGKKNHNNARRSGANHGSSRSQQQRRSAGGNSNAVTANGRRKVVASASSSKRINRDARKSVNGGIVTTEQDLQRHDEQQQQQHAKRGRPSGTNRRRYSDPGNIDSILMAELVKQQELAKQRMNQENNGKLERFIEATAPNGKNRKLARALNIKDERDRNKTTKKALLYEVAMRLEEARKKKGERMREELRVSRRTMAQATEQRSSGNSGNSGTSSLAYEVAKKREKLMLDRIAWKKKVERLEKRAQKIQSCG